MCKQLLRAKSWKPSQDVSQVRDETDTFVEFFELFVAEIFFPFEFTDLWSLMQVPKATFHSSWTFHSQEFLKIFRKILSWFLLHVCSHPRALTCLFLCLYVFVHFWRRVMNQNVSGKNRYCHKDNTTDQNSPPVVSMKRLFVVSKPYSHTSPGTLSWPPGLLRPSGAMSRRGAGVHARPTGGLRTEGLERPSACTSAFSALGGEVGFHHGQPIRLRCVDMKHNSKRSQTVFVWKTGMGRKDWFFWIQTWAFWNGIFFRGELLVWGWRNLKCPWNVRKLDVLLNCVARIECKMDFQPCHPPWN